MPQSPETTLMFSHTVSSLLVPLLTSPYVSLGASPFLCELTVLETKTQSKVLGGCTVRKDGGSDMKHRRLELTEVILSFILQLFPNKSSCPTKPLFPNLLIFKCSSLENIVLYFFFFFFGRTSWEGSQFLHQGLNSGIAVK